MMGREREKKKYTRKPQKTNQTAKGATDADWSPFVVVRTLTMVTTATTTTRNGAHKTTEQREPGIAMKYDDDDDGTRMRTGMWSGVHQLNRGRTSDGRPE